ncbi:hypothetical protein H1R20_g7078, partial [Candolleomyces eurysporus]
MDWIERCVSEEFLMPIAEYTLDENDLCRAGEEGSRSFDSSTSTSTSGNVSSDLTAVNSDSSILNIHAELREQIPALPPSDVQRNGKSAENRLEEDRVSDGIGKASAGAGGRELERKALPHLLKKRRSVERMKVSFLEPKTLSIKQETIGQSPPALVKPAPRSAVAGTLKAAQSKVATKPGARMSSPFQEFFDSVPKELQKSTAFLGMLAIAADKLKTMEPQSGNPKSPSESRADEKAYKPPSCFADVNGRSRLDKDGTMRIPIEQLLQDAHFSSPSGMVTLNINEVYRGRRFQISNPEEVFGTRRD